MTITKTVSRLIRRVWPGHATASAFPGSAEYWRQRYADGGNSGAGSYKHLAAFKAEVLNELVRDKGIRSVIEYGCGDGNQLTLADYPSYLGFDVSPEAVAQCQKLFRGDRTKSFALVTDQPEAKAELTLSLDVVYHLVEDAVFHQYMERLFDTSERVVVVYSSNYESDPATTSAHVRHREFTRWVAVHRPAWRLTQHIPNRYPFQGDNKQGSHADFYIFEQTP